jgi:dihydroorotate dehydrogenase (NAD+) catalytic subunit
MTNPLMLASGILGVTAETMMRVASAGAGGVVTKSIGLIPKEGHPNPSVIEVPHGLLNAMGLPNPGIDDFGSELQKLKFLNTPVIGSIFGTNEKEYAKLARKMEEFGVQGIELNLSCPHAEGTGYELGTDPEIVKKIVKEVKSAVEIPVFAKLTPHVPRIVDIGRAALDAKADGLVAVNTIRAMSIDINTKMPVLGNKIGGYSGPALKPIGVRAVYELKSELDAVVIGVGGIMTAKDVVEYLMAGASAVQLGSAVFYHGMEIFKEINSDLVQLMKEHGYEGISELIGSAIKK